MCIWCAVTKCNDDNDLTERQIEVFIKHMRKDYAGTEAKLNGPYGHTIWKIMEARMERGNGGKDKTQAGEE